MPKTKTLKNKINSARGLFSHWVFSSSAHNDELLKHSAAWAILGMAMRDVLDLYREDALATYLDKKKPSSPEIGTVQFEALHDKLVLCFVHGLQPDTAGLLLANDAPSELIVKEGQHSEERNREWCDDMRRRAIQSVKVGLPGKLFDEDEEV